MTGEFISVCSAASQTSGPPLTWQVLSNLIGQNTQTSTTIIIDDPETDSEIVTVNEFDGLQGIPAGKTVLDIVCQIRGSVIAQPGTTADFIGVQLQKAGVATPQNVPLTAMPTINQSTSFQPADPLWGTTWTLAELKNPATGFRFFCRRNVLGLPVNLYSLQLVRMIVTTDGSADPLLAIYYNDVPVIDGGTIGTITFETGKSATFVFLLRNDGDADLTLDAVTPVAISNGLEYSIFSAPAPGTIITPGSTVPVVITVDDPTVPGLRALNTMTVTSDDPNSPTYDIIMRAEILAVGAQTCQRWQWRERGGADFFPPRRACP